MEPVKAGLVTIGNFILPAVWLLVFDGLYGRQEIPVICLLVLLLFLFVLRFLRSRGMELPAFLITHLSALACADVAVWIVAESPIEAVLFTIFLIGYTVFSFYIRSREENRDEDMQHPALFACLLAIAYLAANWLPHIPGLDRKLPFAAVFFFGIYFVHYFLENYDTFTSVNRLSAGNFQSRRLFGAGGLLAGGYVLLCIVIFLLLANQEWGISAAKMLGKGLLTVITFLFSLLGRGEGGSKVESIQPEVQEKIEYIESGFWGPLIGKILDGFLTIVTVVLLVAAVVLVVRWICQILRKKEKIVTMSDAEDAVSDKVERLEKETHRSKKRSSFYERTVNGRIRKIYASYVKRNKDEIERNVSRKIPFTTARECIGEDAGIYEKARYSGKECDSNSLRSFKKTLSK